MSNKDKTTDETQDENIINPSENKEVKEDKECSSDEQVPKTDAEIIEDLKDQLLRQKAEFVNAQNRARKELEDAKFFATKMIMFRLIPVLDEINRAKEHENFDKESPIATTISKLEESIKDIGVSEYGEKGEKFDVSIHDAMGNIEKEGIEETQIEAVVSKGYKFKDIVIRAAQVMTVSPKKPEK